jgi:hypothetical protein
MNTGTSFLHRELRALREAEVQDRIRSQRKKLDAFENLEWFQTRPNTLIPYRRGQWGRASRCGTLERTRVRMDRLRLEIEALEASLRRGIRVDGPSFNVGGGQ